MKRIYLNLSKGKKHGRMTSIVFVVGSIFAGLQGAGAISRETMAKSMALKRAFRVGVYE